MREQVSNAIYDILIDTCGAAPELRSAFVQWYGAERLRPFRFGGAALCGHGLFQPTGPAYMWVPGYEATRRRVERCAQANQQIAGLMRALLAMSPLERVAWWRARIPAELP